MKVACIQMRAGSVHEYQETYARILQLTERAGKERAQLTVLPECAYPAYFLGLDIDKLKESLAMNDRLLSDIATLAKRYGMYVAVGLVTEREGKLYNSAVMIDPAGRQINMVDKSNMWHFDGKWFTSGSDYGVFDTVFGTMGMMVCADGRLPEIARILALQGARVIVDPVNLAAAASDPKMLSNQQYQFILQARAAENGAWLLVADKVGLEGGCASYLGRSMVIDPDGNIVACASTDEEEILYHDVNPEQTPRTPPIARMPVLYQLLDKPNEMLAACRDAEKSLAMKDCEIFTTVTQFASASANEYIEKAAHYLSCGKHMGSRLVLLPQSLFDMDAIVDALIRRIPESIIAVASGKDREGVKCAAAFSAQGKQDIWRKTHASANGEIVSNELFHCADTACGKLGVIFDEEAYVPEIARSYMLDGCNILLWADSAARSMNLKMMQTRCAENKMFMARSSCDPHDDACICDTEGRILTSTFTGVEQAASGMIVYPLSLAKSVVPGTDVLFGRTSGSYGELTKIHPEAQ